MISYIIRRLLLIIPTVLGITFLIFMLVANSPGGVGAALQAASGQMEQSDRAKQTAYLEERYGLNDPPVVQYLRWLSRISPIKFGTRDQVKPGGEVIRLPKPIQPPILAGVWYGPSTLPSAPTLPNYVFADTDIPAPPDAPPHATIRWLADEDAPVARGTPIAQLAVPGSDAIPVQILAPAAGRLHRLIDDAAALPATGPLAIIREDRQLAYDRAADRYARTRAAFIAARAELEDAIRLYASWGADRLRSHNDATQRLRERRALRADPGDTPPDQLASLDSQIRELESRLLPPDLLAQAQAHRDRFRGSVARDNDLRPAALRRIGLDADHPLTPGIIQAGERAMTAYQDAQRDRAALIAVYRARPFRQAGVWVIPGVLSLATPDMGVSFSRGRSVVSIIKEALPVTLTLNIIAFPVIYLLAVPTGLLAAVKKGRLFDHLSGALLVGLWSIPVLVASVLMVGFLANKNQILGDAHFPTGFTPPGHETMPFLPDRAPDGSFIPGLLLSQLHHMVLPLVALIYPGLAILSKQTRASMLDNFSADYVRTAKAKGVSAKDVILRHVLRNSLLPLITMFATIFPAMLGGSIIVERVYDIDGMGSLVLEAINLRDRELLLANVMLITCVNLLALLLADILYAIADPRISYS